MYEDLSLADRGELQDALSEWIEKVNAETGSDPKRTRRGEI